MNYDFDVIIVGSSSSGILSALSISQYKENLRIVLFDKRKSINHSIHPANSFYIGMYKKTNEIINNCYVLHKINGMKLISPKKNEIILKNDGWAINKLKFDRYYIKKIIKNNVQVYFNFEVLNVKNNIHKSEVIVRNNDTKVIYNYTAKIVIFADGIDSISSKILKLKTMKYYNDIALGLEAKINYPNIGSRKYAEYYFGSHAPGWKSSYLPMGNNTASVGIYVRNQGKDIRNLFEKWFFNFRNENNIPIDKNIICSIKYGGDPIITIPNQIYDNRILVVGGAAGQSGIAYSMVAGKIAGYITKNAINKNNFSKKYLSNYYYIWKKKLYWEHILGRITLKSLDYLNDNQLDYLFDLFKNIDMETIIKDNAITTSKSILKTLLKKDPYLLFKLINIKK